MFKLRATVVPPSALTRSLQSALPSLFGGALLCASALHAGIAQADWSNVHSATSLLVPVTGTLYAADSSAVYGSSDAGKTWTKLGSPQGAVSAMAYLGGRLWVGTTASGTSYSTDGKSWIQALNGQTIPPLITIPKPISALAGIGSSTLLAANNAGMYRSTSSGSSWDSNVTGLPGTVLLGNVLPGPVAALASNSSGALAGTANGAYRSTDGGASWSLAGLTGISVTVLHAAGSSTYFAIGGGKLYKSTDNGSSWTTVNSIGSVTPTAMTSVDGNAQTLYVGTESGTVLQSTDGGSTWTNIADSTLPSRKILALAVPGSDPTALVAATDTGTYLYTATTATTQTPFSFANRSGVTPGEKVESDSITVGGLTQPAAISIQGGEYSINGGNWTSATGSVITGATVKVRLTASSSYNTSSSATLTIGKLSAQFSVTTLQFTPVTTPTDLLTTPPGSGVSVVNGVLKVDSTTTLELKPNAPSNALLQITNNTPVQVVIGGNTTTVTPTDTTTTFTTRQVTGSNGQPVTALAVASGSANFSSTAPISLPFSGSTSGSGSLSLGNGGSVQVNVSAGQTGGGVLSGTGTISAPIRGSTSANRFSAGGTTIYGGESFTIDQSGYLSELRIGSLKGDKGLSGDPLSLANLDSGVKVPKLDGNLNRLSSSSLVDVAKAGLDAQFGGSGSASYDATTGILSYTLNGKTYRFIPLGSATVALGSAAAAQAGNFSATNAAAATSGAFSLTNRGVQLTLSSALGYFSELDKAIKGFDASGSFKLRSDGSLKFLLGGATLVASAGSAVTTSAQPGPTFGMDASGLVTFIDSAGSTQIFYPVFSDPTVLLSTLQGIDSKASYSNLGNGTVEAVAPAWKFTFRPDYLIKPLDKTAHANDLWWLDGGKVVLRYPDDTVQSFGL